MNCIRDSCNRYAILIAIVSSSFAVAINVNNDVLEYWIPSFCKYDEYFDTLSLSCSRCNASKNLEVATNRLQCVCNMFSRMIGFENGNPLCVACGSNMIATTDGKECILRSNATCKCSSNEIRLDRNVNGILLDTVLCVTCIQGTYPSTDCSKCLPCDGREYSGRANCVCPSATHVRLRNYCLRKDDVTDWPDVRTMYLMKFQSDSVDSYYLRSELQVAVHLCKRKDRMACEHLSNICALTLYTDGIACMLFMHAPLAPVWLFYSKQDTVSILNDTRISERYSLRREDNSSILDFAIAKFSLNGEFLSIGRPSLPCQLLRNVRFGVNYNKRCKTTAVELLNAQVELLSPYLIFKDGNKSFTHALPVIVKPAGEAPQNIGEVLQQQLVRRFFLVDNISGFKALPTFMNTRFVKAPKLSVLRYMKSLTVLVNVQNGEKHGKIFAPFLIAQYDELTYQDLLDNPDVVIEYKVTFTLKDSDMDYNVQITIGILTGIALLFSTIRAWSYYKRNHNGNLSITVLLWFLVYAMGAVGNIITFVCIGTCVYLFVFYKGQTVPYILLPDDASEKRIQTYISVAFSFKIVEMIGFICQHWDLSVFFIDWEQPRTIHNQMKYDSPHTSLRKLYANRFPRNDGTSTRISSDIIASKRKRRLRRTNGNASPSEISKSSMTDKYAPDFSSIYSLSRSPLQERAEHSYVHNVPISVWRTYFVANEWCKLQTKRRINVALQSIYTLCILQIFDLKSWMLAVPEANVADKLEARNNFILQYAICTFVYVSVYFAQWLIRVTFYERYIRNRLQKFVDLCSVANISVLVLVHNYYGFYIHGRSVHGYADTDLLTLINDLKKEEDNLCAHRGLVPGTTEQTFIVSLTQSFKSLYDELMKHKNNENIGTFRGSDTSFKSWKQLNETRSKVKMFLTQFLDHCSESEDYIIKEQHILEKLCDILFQDAKDKSVFYIDNNYSFNRVILYGNEWLLATFEITVFAFFLALYDTYIFACITTVLISQLFLIIIRCNVKRNLCNKSLLDKRFFM